MSDKKSKVKEGFSTVLFMIIVTVIFISVLSVVYLQTKETIRLNEQLAVRKAILYAADIEVPQSSQNVAEVFQSRLEEIREDSVYKVMQNGSLQSYVFITSGAGLWGKITAAIGLEKDLKTVTGIEFISQNETPGLGARITEKWFKEQFRGKQGKFSQLVPEGEQAQRDQFQAVTGATITSTSVRKIINQLIETAPELVK